MGSGENINGESSSGPTRGELREAAGRGGHESDFGQELRDVIFDALRMTQDECEQRFHVVRKQEKESWTQFSTDLNAMFGYYMESRKVEAMNDLRQLIISDRLKHIPNPQIRSPAAPQESNLGLLRAKRKRYH
ncbi:hypothetical protein HPB47_026623 [Ixodes persulcatus]|uniref:Uncharacterized protein n=1 Tax=Ixodes persulcatus TaxID=34615 RepID=A0AC60R0A1_IXOPE|nr:hypothetical protein HPB47_026623 [Ixodes persulcatus]